MTYLVSRVAVLMLAALACGQAAAQDYPTRPVTIVLPYSAGTGIDSATRSLADNLQKRLGQPFVVLNKVGAGGNIGTEFVVKSAPDGYTTLVVANTLATNPSLYRNLRYEPLKDLAPVGLLLKGAMVLVAGTGAPAQDLRSLVEQSKREPGKFNYASPGVGTPQHLAMEMLKNLTRFDVQHIPHKGAAEAVTSVAGNQVHMGFVPIQSALPLIAGGKLRPLAVSSPRRSDLMPNVPTVGELLGIAFDVDLWYGMFLPAGTPEAIVTRLARELKGSMEAPEMQAKLAAVGLSPALSSPEALRELTRKDMERWAAVIKQAGITAE